jgi:hypothetical protein
MEPLESFFVVHTSDPTSPTFKVPIIIDYEGKYALPPFTSGWHEGNVSHIWVRPNPIRLDRQPEGTTTTKELCLAGSGEIVPPRITEIRVYGPGLSITGARDGDGTPIPLPISTGSHLPSYLVLTYVSEGDTPVDGVLAISFLNNFDDEFTLGVPIIIR